jgi:hypothetical protein
MSDAIEPETDEEGGGFLFETWPELPYHGWAGTCRSLHMWTQVIGKVRLALAPMENHWWNIPLYVTARGLTTSPMPAGELTVQADFDFLSHEFRVVNSLGMTAGFALRPMPVAAFYGLAICALQSVMVYERIWTTPVEVPDPVPFDEDVAEGEYDPVAAEAFWRVLVATDRVLKRFRGEFLGKASPVHFFWGSFDLAYTRFSGRPAPPHPGAPNVADSVTREAYSHEVSSVGFWPGAEAFPEPVFYAYAYPAPDGYAEASVQPEAAYFNREWGEFMLPYEAVLTADDPEAALLAFCRSTYEAAADLGRWDRASLERQERAIK